MTANKTLREWCDDYTKWLKQMADERKACLACEQDEYLSDPDTDLDAAMLGSRADSHEGPYCKKAKVAK
jgi:hypothetical protein